MRCFFTASLLLSLACATEHYGPPPLTGDESDVDDGSDDGESSGDAPAQRDWGDSSVLRVDVGPGFDEQVVPGAAALLLELSGIEVIVEHDARVTIMHWDEPQEGYSGFTSWDTPEGCTVESWAIDSPIVAAHELGHALGLVHVSDAGNLMYQHPDAAVLTPDQVETMRHRAWLLEHACE